MLTKILLFLTLLFAMNCYAQTATPTIPAATTPATDQESTHKSKDALFRSCKNEADQKNLTGVERSAYIAACVKR
jgi:hypothetical protein